MNKKKKKKVLVVLGGTSGERAVSLESGKACVKALKKRKYIVSTFDPKHKNFNLINRKNSEIDINIQIKEPFAKNQFNQEIIFTDNSIGSFSFFKEKYINSIDLIDISNNPIQINNYLRKSLAEINNLFEISQIEYVDGRRYNLYLAKGPIIMLPKKINEDLLIFIKQNYEILKNNTNFQEYLDLRNFHEKTIRAK